ncbi:hypothetical protein DMX09_24730 [Pseudomonas protegens]|nr:hypothetical protein DMX09_24730 [Pseudomonas protegens]
MIHVPPVAVTDSLGGATKYPALGSPLEIVLGAAKVQRLNLIWHCQQQLASGGSGCTEISARLPLRHGYEEHRLGPEKSHWRGLIS